MKAQLNHCSRTQIANLSKILSIAVFVGSLSGMSQAAQVQLYGVVDTGIRYLHSDLDFAGKYDASDRFSMESGMQSSSRFGFKSVEVLGNGLQVGFVLEEQFLGDTGAMADADLMFRRESSLFLQGGMGKIAFGRMGSVNNGVSSWGRHAMISAFSTSWGSYTANADNLAGNSGLWDNMISYETPNLAGFKVFAQYSMGNQLEFDDEKYGVENESSSDRYLAVGATYANGPLSLYIAVDSVNYATSGTGSNSNADDSFTVTIGGNYNFDVAKFFAGASYFDEVKMSNYGGAASDYFNHENFGDFSASDLKIKGWSIGVSGSIPAVGGEILLGTVYLDAEAADTMEKYDRAGTFANAEINRWIVSAGYNYPLSKQTNAYVIATYVQDSIEAVQNHQDADPTVFGVMIGMRHKF